MLFGREIKYGKTILQKIFQAIPTTGVSCFLCPFSWGTLSLVRTRVGQSVHKSFMRRPLRCCFVKKISGAQGSGRGDGVEQAVGERKANALVAGRRAADVGRWQKEKRVTFATLFSWVTPVGLEPTAH